MEYHLPFKAEKIHHSRYTPTYLYPYLPLSIPLSDNYDEIPDFYEFNLFTIFKIFRENSHNRNGHF